MPGDKSISHRVLLLAAIASGRTTAIGLNRGSDVRATQRALAAVGVNLVERAGDLCIDGVDRFVDPAATLDCANSATSLRLLMGLLAGRVRAQLTGDASLRRRPMARVADPLRQLGARIELADGDVAPVRLFSSDARLRGGDFRLEVASAQVKSALLVAGLRASGTVTVESPLPSRDHTERLLLAMNGPLRLGGPVVAVRAGALEPIERYDVPGDISAAAFFLVAAASLPGHRLTIRGVGLNPTRSAVLDALRAMGARVSIANVSTAHFERRADLEIEGGHPLRGIAVRAAAVPNLIDELPALCALGTVAGGAFEVRGAAELRHKESDRIAATAGLLRAFGAEVDEAEDGLAIRGGTVLRPPARVTTSGDHRIGMTAAALAAMARSEVVIEDADCIDTSFPGFQRTWLEAFA